MAAHSEVTFYIGKYTQINALLKGDIYLQVSTSAHGIDMKAYSAPGKALIAGGYLVLDASYNAYVTALSTRMHAVVGPSSDSEISYVKVTSPQFCGEWEYRFENSQYIGGVVEVAGRINPFLEATVATVLSYIEPKSRFAVDITIYSDPGYHAQADTEVKTSENGTKHFLFHNKPINEVAKTGLGSSAGLVSVVTGAMLSYFGVDVENSKSVVHNVAQVAHCYAQKKTGSGFDVAAAVFGSIVYRRFQPSVVDSLFQHQVFAKPSQDLQHDYHQELVKTVDQEWEFTHNPCTLPPHIRLLMGDIKGGSETPKLVAKVLKWKLENPVQSEELYKNLNQANEDLMSSLTNLHLVYKNNQEQYLQGIDYFASRPLCSIESYLSIQPKLEIQLAPFLDLVNALKSIRSNLRKLSRFTGEDIEPKSQTLILNNCSSLKGCFGGVVPGAGGYDAISLLVVDTAIEPLLNDTVSDKRFSNVSWLHLHEQENGIILENPEDYIGL